MSTQFYQAKTLFFIPLKLGAYILAVLKIIWNSGLIAVWSYILHTHHYTDVDYRTGHSLLYYKFDKPSYETRNNIERFHSV